MAFAPRRELEPGRAALSGVVRKARSLWTRMGQVGPWGWLLLMRAWWFLLAAKIALRLIPVKRVIAWKQRALPQEARDVGNWCARIRWAILTAAHYSPVSFVCFPQCLAASELLRAVGIPSRLHYGVKREGGKLLTHTWLEAEGDIVIGGEVADQFSTLDVY